MKTSDLKQIMQLAWQFFKQTGYKFSECLKKAMQTQIVRFYFQKVDGSIREAWGTLSPILTPQTSEKQRKTNKTIQIYFDTEIQDFRCFKKFNLIP